MKYTRLSSEEIERTVENLFFRINERFPDSGLSRVAKKIHEVARETNQTVEWISRPSIRPSAE